jgi:predicted ATPase
VIRRFYVHNFRCLENFELPLAGVSSALLIGQNGAGKSTVGMALEILQKISRGINRIRELVPLSSVTQGHHETPVRFELEVELNARTYQYVLALELPAGFRELRVMEEKLSVGGELLYSRDRADITLAARGTNAEARFTIDWHLVALPIVHEKSMTEPLFLFKQWLARILILSPIPSLISGESADETLMPQKNMVDFGDWFAGLLKEAPAAYSKIDKTLKAVLPDFKDIQNPPVAKDVRSLLVQFAQGQGTVSIPFADLSDGEKCFMIWAVVLAANETHGPLFCFWDEPDNYLSLDQVGHFAMDIRRVFEASGQFVATSHHSEAIRSFPSENIFVLHRRNHLEPTLLRPLSELSVAGDLVGTLIRGDLNP